MPASASPAVTFVTTPFTFCSRLTGVTVTPAVSKICWAYLPHGTSGAQTTTLRSDFARSATPVMPAGLPVAHDDREQVRGEDHRLGAVQARLGELVHVGRIGRREHVGGRALEICCTSADEASKLNVTFASGLARRERGADVVEGAVSDAAAKTVMSPETGAVVDAGAEVTAVESEAEADDAADDPLSSPQAAARSPKRPRRRTRRYRPRRMAGL